MKTLTSDTIIKVRAEKPILTSETRIKLSQIKDLLNWINDSKKDRKRQPKGQENGGEFAREYGGDYSTNLKELQKTAEPIIKKFQEENPEFIESIKTYTDSGSDAINSAMRTGIKDAPLKVQRNIANISQALERNEIGSNVIAYRRIEADDETLKSIFEKFGDITTVDLKERERKLQEAVKMGLDYTEKSFLSTSINPNYKQHENGENGLIKMKIKVPKETKGLFVNDISSFKGRSAELLIQRRTYMVFTNVKYNIKKNEYEIEAEIKNKK